ncbi:methylenetetrahydrofolate reductase [Catellatospora sichuanensis]|uniref:methylenetetrahydrofolate reductase n=1 Tax=Catellatospora sichuanensis TaxID=1969805 RepID=UPI001181ED34|nr:methylenetetrahydrofolate reductase [Catellatospora sichuanensis]
MADDTARPGRRSLRAMLERADAGVLLLGITPPRRSVSPEQAAQIAEVTLARLATVDLDGLILYDIDDESDRNPQERPFPYLPTMDPVVFHRDHLGSWELPAVIYRCVGKYTEPELADWLGDVDTDRVLGVFVGASSRDKGVRTGLTQAYALRDRVRADLPLGAVAITERYTRTGDEHLRMLTKQDRGTSFFITQVVYDVDATKSLLSDYFYTCAQKGVTPRPVIFTLSVCGSLKTLSFLHWLGVDVPRWLENALRYSDDPLTESYQQCLATARELAAFCRRLGVPFGFNVESVSIRKVEIEASVELAREVRALLNG